MDDDIFSQFDLGPAPAQAGGPKPPPMNPNDGEPRPNGRKKGKAAKVAKGKRGRPKKEQLYMAKGAAIEPVKADPTKPKARAPRKAREAKISLTAAAEAFAGLTDSDVAFVTAAIRNMSGMTAQQKKRVVHTLTRLFA